MKKRVVALVFLLLLSLVLGGCGNQPKDYVLITDYLTLSDNGSNTISYGTNYSELGEQFETVTLQNSREYAHENLLISFESFVFFEDPAVIQLEITAEEPILLPSWATPQGVKVGTPLSQVLEIYGKTAEDLKGNLLDILYAQYLKEPTKMYEVRVSDFHSLSPEQKTFRILISFENDAVDKIILGDLDSMA